MQHQTDYSEQQIDEFKHEFAQRWRRQLIVGIVLGAIMVCTAIAGQANEDALVLGIPPSIATAVFVVTLLILVSRMERPKRFYRVLVEQDVPLANEKSIIGALVFSIANWRCPACGAYMGKQMSPKFCSSCGVPSK